MSFHTYHVYGYGIAISDLGKIDDEKVMQIIDMAPQFKERAQEHFKSENIENPSVNDYLEYALEDSSTNCGLSQIISCAIYENEKIEFTACTDFSDEEYVLYEQAYPWHMSKLDFTMTEDKVKEILQKYIKVLTDKEIEICSRDPENGG